MHQERRRFKRFSATAFLNRPISLAPLPPHFGKKLEGRLIDLSAGGLAMFVERLIPQGHQYWMTLAFPDRSVLETPIEIRHVLPRGQAYLIGVEFLKIPDYMRKKVEAMSTDYLECEERISAHIKNVCLTDCAFFTMCNKPQKTEPVINVDLALQMTLREMGDQEKNSINAA